MNKFTIKFKVTIAYPKSRIASKHGEIDMQCDLTLEEMKQIQESREMKNAIKEVFPPKTIVIDIKVLEINFYKEIKSKKAA